LWADAKSYRNLWRKSEGGRLAPLGGNSSEAGRAACRLVGRVERNQRNTCALPASVEAEACSRKYRPSAVFCQVRDPRKTELANSRQTAWQRVVPQISPGFPRPRGLVANSCRNRRGENRSQIQMPGCATDRELARIRTSATSEHVRYWFKIISANFHEPSLCRFNTWNPVPCQLTGGASGDILNWDSCAPHSHAKPSSI